MKESFLNGSKHLIKDWKKIRAMLRPDMSDIEHLTLVSNFWSYAPLSVRVLNWDTPVNWPDPWKLIADMEFDESAISLGMKYTLELSSDNRWLSNRCNLILIKDSIAHIQRIVLFIDNKWLLNYNYKSIIDTENNPQKFLIQQRYSYDGKMHTIIDNSTDMMTINSSDKDTE